MNGGAAAGTAVPFGLPARFLLTGVAALAFAGTSLAFRPELLLGSHLVPSALAVVHTLTLGFGTMVLVGAMHQLVPVLLVAPLHSTSYGGATYALLAPGALSIVIGFGMGYRVPWLAVGGILVLAGLAVFDVNLARTARSASDVGAVGRTMLTAAGYLTGTAVLGLLVATSRLVPGLAGPFGSATPLHLGFGFAAFFLAIAAAGHKLLAMFVLAHGVSPLRLRVLAWLVHAAVALLALGTFTGATVAPAAAVLFAVAVATFTVDTIMIVRKRVRRRIEPSMRPYLAAPAFLVLAAVLGILGHGPAAVASLLLGFLPLAIAGMLVKVVSFLVWQHRYAPLVGTGTVPMLRDMSLPSLDRVVSWSLATGAAACAVAMAGRWPVPAAIGAPLLMIGAWTLLAHVVWIVWRPHTPAGARRGARGAAVAPEGGA